MCGILTALISFAISPTKFTCVCLNLPFYQLLPSVCFYVGVTDDRGVGEVRVAVLV